MNHNTMARISFLCLLIWTTTSSAADAWTSNGGTACDKYLTPGVLAEILTDPSGKSSKLSDQSCNFTGASHRGTISITLTAGGPEAFAAYQQYLTDPVPLAGVGDKAIMSLTGLQSVKGKNRSCGIDAGGSAGYLKIKGDALGQKLGAICNKLFALP